MAVRLQEAGSTTYAVARRVERMKDLEAAGVTTFAMDVTDDDLDDHRHRSDPRGARRVDVLVNNAGYGSYGAVENVPIAEARASSRSTCSVSPG